MPGEAAPGHPQPYIPALGEARAKGWARGWATGWATGRPAGEGLEADPAGALGPSLPVTRARGYMGG